MLEDFLSYILEELSIKKTDKVLLAVSGGVDSMVMLDLFHNSDIDIEVGHVNHSTRNGASDDDEHFLKSYCFRHDIKFHSIKLDYDLLSKGNFQQNARKARYEFFQEIMNERDISHLATAHHQDDRWETFVMNLNRKAGIKGLTSLKPKTGSTIRPLILFRKEEILQYAKDNTVPFVEDSSNSHDDYTRNAIRHHVSPAMENTLPGFITNANQSISYLQNIDELLTELVTESNFSTVDPATSHVIIDLEQIKKKVNKVTLAQYILSPFGFNNSDINDILKTKQTGSVFLSQSYEALYDRERLIIREKKEAIFVSIQASKSDFYTLQDGRIIAVNVEKSRNSSKDIIYLNTDFSEENLLTIRSVLPGDRYYPAHMKGKSKSVKKHLNDLKIDRFKKEQVLVIEVDSKIIQVHI